MLNLFDKVKNGNANVRMRTTEYMPRKSVVKLFVVKIVQLDN